MSYSNGHKIWSLKQWDAPRAPDTLDKEKHHTIAFLAKQQDFDCLMLAEFGMELKTIARHTGLSKGQVSYRTKKAGVRVRDFRQGMGPYARMVFQYLGKHAARQLTMEVREKFTDV